MLDYTDHDAAAMHADWTEHDARFSAMDEFRRAGFWLSRASTPRAAWWEVWGSEVLICFPTLPAAVQWLRSRQNHKRVLECEVSSIERGANETARQFSLAHPAPAEIAL